jgi:hypothetical protein
MEGGEAGAPHAFVRRYNVYFQKDPPAFPAFLLTHRKDPPGLTSALLM